MKVKLIGHKEESSHHSLVMALKPKKVFYPITDDVTLLVSPGDYVYKGMLLGKHNSGKQMPIYSSVSGTFVEVLQCQYVNGIYRSIVIENDFKEKLEKSKVVKDHIQDFTRDEFLHLLHDSGIVGLGGAGFPTYIKYDTNCPIKTLIVNAVECEPYITADDMIVREKCEAILECLDAIMKIMGIDDCVIAVKKTNSDIVNLFQTYIGTYVNMRLCLVPNIYPMGWERTLIQEVMGVTYDFLPIEKGIVVSNVSTVYAIYEALKFGKPLIERIVTFTGDMFTEPCNVLVKIGSNVADVISQFGRYKRNKDIYFVVGGPMMGKSLPSDDLVIEAHMNCILAIKANVESYEQTCLRCGKCVDVCPARISPVLIQEHLDYDNLIDFHPERCIECGLCSYICPAQIMVRSHVKLAKKKLLERKGV